MDRMESKYIPADDIIQNFMNNPENPENKVDVRFQSLFKQMKNFIESSNLQGKVAINEMVLFNALMDYFEDINRLKEFHKIKHINGIKVVSYTAFWLVKRKPLQVLSNEKELLYVNEKFVLMYLCNFLSSKRKKFLLDRPEKGLYNFSEFLLYYLKYRLTDAKSLELMLISFFAGQIYQEETEDISSKLPPSRIEEE